MEERVKHPLIDPRRGINSRTVQVLALHPLYPTWTLWVHNLPESIAVYILRYGNTVKPPGWGLAGGGQEPHEVEKLRGRDPNHPILANPHISEEDRAIAACGLREFRDESGYEDILIRTMPLHKSASSGPSATVRLYDYRMKDRWPDGSETTHEIVLLWGEVESLAHRPIQELDEVDKSEWFDVSRPLCEIFRDRAATPGFPYWSHVRRTIIGIQRIDWWRRFFNEEEKSLSRLIHPSWRLVFPVGRGDDRYPRNGFRIPPAKWYYLVEMMIQEQMETVGANFIYELFREDIELAVELERMCEERERPPQAKMAPETAAETEEEEVVADELGGETNRQTLLRRQDEEYRVWMERELRVMGLLEDE